MANTMLLLLQFAAALVFTIAQQAGWPALATIDDRTEDRSISLAFVRRVPSSLSTSSIHRSILSGHCLLARVLHRDRPVTVLARRHRLAASAVVPEVPVRGHERWRTRLPRSTSALSGCTNSSRSQRPMVGEGVTAAAPAEEGQFPPDFTWAAVGITEEEEEVSSSS